MAGVGFRKGSALILTEASENAEGNLRVGLSYGGQSWICQSALKGAHHANNLGFAMMVGLSMHIPPERLLRGVSSISPLKGRGKWIRNGRVHLVIDESYNANPSSVSAALEVLGKLQVPGRRWAVLGGMRELGEASKDLHRLILAKTKFLDGVVLVGEEWEPFRSETEPGAFHLWWAKDGKEAGILLERVVGTEDTVLVKGSRSYGLESVVEGLSRP
jgi:UDP-N-acetylmuramyl pentapeptide synthase